MLFGQPYDCFWGNPDDQWLRFNVDSLNRNECRVTARAFADAEQNGVVVIDGIALKMKRILETVDAVMICQYPDPTRTSHFVSLVPWGDASWPLLETYPEDQQILHSEDKSNFRELTLTPNLDYRVIVDDDLDTQLSSFNLEGVARYWTGVVTPELRTRLEMWVVVETVTGTHTISIYMDDSKEMLLAQGTITGNGTCTLTAQDENIILSGVVDITWTGDFEGTLLVRYPAQFKIYVDNALSKTIDMASKTNDVVVLIGPFEAGSHTFKAKMLSDDGELSDYGNEVTETIPGPPEPCSNLVVISGDYSNTKIGWTVSTTPGATTNVYDPEALDTPPDIDAPVNTSANNVTLSAIPASAGVRTVIVDSTLAGVESGFRQIIEIEYDAAGAIVPARPNVPDFSFSKFGLANLLKIRYTYSRADEKSPADLVYLFVTDDPDTFDFTNPPQAYVTVATDSIQQSGVLTYTLPSAESYYWIVRAVDADGVLSSNTDWQGPVFATPDAPAAPTLSLRAV